MNRVIKAVVDLAKGKTPSLSIRSPKWKKARLQHLHFNPYCAACGGAEKLEVHHIEPFHMRPERELDPDNLITLCESKRGGLTCHQFVGHYGNYRDVNPTVKADAELIRLKFFERIGHE